MDIKLKKRSESKIRVIFSFECILIPYYWKGVAGIGVYHPYLRYNIREVRFLFFKVVFMGLMKE